jgi:hypothetical protein
VTRRFSGLAEKVARELLSITEQPTTPPVDLDAIGTLLGVRSVSRMPLIEDGRLVWDHDGPRVELRVDRPAARQRFTHAHELAHLIVSSNDRLGTVARRTVATDPDGEEALCDAIAAALLMPRTWIEPRANGRLNLSILRVTAKRAEVSLAAAAVRIAEVADRTCMLLRWQAVHGNWVCASAAAVPPHLYGRIRVGERTAANLMTLRRGDTWIDASLTFDGRAAQARAHVDRVGRTCLMLVTDLVISDTVEADRSPGLVSNVCQTNRAE